jgi:hypothetical protein
MSEISLSTGFRFSIGSNWPTGLFVFIQTFFFSMFVDEVGGNFGVILITKIGRHKIISFKVCLINCDITTS